MCERGKRRLVLYDCNHQIIEVPPPQPILWKAKAYAHRAEFVMHCEFKSNSEPCLKRGPLSEITTINHQFSGPHPILLKLLNSVSCDYNNNTSRTRRSIPSIMPGWFPDFGCLVNQICFVQTKMFALQKTPCIWGNNAQTLYKQISSIHSDVQPPAKLSLPLHVGVSCT